MMRISFFVWIGIVSLLTGCSLSHPSPSSSKQQTLLQDVPFDRSMESTSAETRAARSFPGDEQRYHAAKASYEQHRPSLMQPHTGHTIPKIIHQIWIGPRLIPSYTQQLQHHIRSLHPDWEYHLWTEAELEKLHLDSWDLVQASTNIAEQADIIRCDLLETFGGVYLDIDMDLLQPLTQLHDTYDFYAGLEAPRHVATTPHQLWVGVSIIGACPGHPIIRAWKSLIRSGWNAVSATYHSSIDQVMNHTFFPFSQAVFEHLSDPGTCSILFPTSYFHPLSSPSHVQTPKSLGSLWCDKSRALLEYFSLITPRPFSHIYPESISVHYWARSWIPNNVTSLKEQQRTIVATHEELYALSQAVQALQQRIEQQARSSKQAAVKRSLDD